MNRQKLVLFLLLVVFACSLVYSYLRSPKQREAAPQGAAPRAANQVLRKAPGAPARAPGEERAVHLELLERQQARYSGFKRNIFSPIFRDEVKPPPFKPLPPPPRPLKQLPPPPPPSKAGAQAPPPPPPPPTEEQLAERELGTFTFLGFLKKNGEKTVFLSKDNEIYLAKKGSNIGPKFYVSDLTDDAITIKSAATGREIVIPLVENKPLTTTRRTSRRTP